MKYFVFEGADNVGKTTLIKEVAAQLKPNSFIIVKEPGGRDALLHEGFSPFICGEAYPSFREQCVNDYHMPENARRAAFLADSIYQYEVVTKPALSRGLIVLSDRSWISDLAYGSVLTDIPIQNLHTFNHIIAERPIGHIFYLTLPKEVRRERYLVVNVMDKKAWNKQDELNEAYRKVFSLYFKEKEVTEVSTVEPAEILAERIVKRILVT